MNVTSLAQAIMESPEFKAAERVYVSIYRVAQHYGGPEEGGWWYYRHQFVGGVPMFNREEAEAFIAQMQRQVDKRNREEAPERHRAMAEPGTADPEKEE